MKQDEQLFLHKKCTLVLWHGLRQTLDEHSGATSNGIKKTTKDALLLWSNNLNILGKEEVYPLLEDSLTWGTWYQQKGAHRMKDTFYC